MASTRSTTKSRAGARSISRRHFLALAGSGGTALLLAACGQSAAPAAPAKTETKPAEAPKPAAQPPAAPAAPAKPAEAPKPAEAAKPTAEAKPAAAGVPKAKISGNLYVLQAKDFHPEHHPFVEKKIKEFAENQGYPLEHAYTEAFTGAGNIVQKLIATVQAGDAPDAMTHTLQPAELKGQELVQDVSALQTDISKEFGFVLPALERRAKLDDKWWAVYHFSRAGGWFIVQTPFKEAGIDPFKELTDWEKTREALLKASKPEKELWGWGQTANRSGDGNVTVRTAVHMWGGQITEETGQLVVLNKDPYREHAIAGLTFMKEIYTEPKWAPMLPPGVNAWSDTGNNEAYLAGKIFFTQNAGTMFAKAVLDNNPVADDTYLVAPPKGMGPGGRSLETVDGTRWFILKGSKNREAAEQLIKAMSATDIQEEMFRISSGYVYPAYEKGWDSKVITESKFVRQVTNYWKGRVFDKNVYTGDDMPGPPSPQIAALVTQNFWTDMFGEILGGKPIPEALTSGHERAVRVFKEFGAKGE
jgi:multiple sugar transport system substrate-binding protein